LTGTGLDRSLRLFLRRLPLLVATVGAGVLAGWLATPASAGYESTAVLFVGTPGSSADTFFNSTTQQGENLLAVTFSSMVVTPSVVGPALVGAGSPRSVGRVLSETKAVAMPSTSLIQITVTDPDAHIAQRLADAIAEQFVGSLARVDPVQTGSTTRSPVAITQPAVLGTAPQPTHLHRNLARGGAFGLAVGIALLVLLDYLDRRPSAGPT